MNPTVYFVWDHKNTPGCANTSAANPPAKDADGNYQRGPFSLAEDINPPSAATIPHTHYPARHSEGFVGLRYDGSAKFRKYSGLNTDAAVSKDFLANVNP